MNKAVPSILATVGGLVAGLAIAFLRPEGQVGGEKEAAGATQSDWVRKSDRNRIGSAPRALTRAFEGPVGREFEEWLAGASVDELRAMVLGNIESTDAALGIVPAIDFRTGLALRKLLRSDADGTLTYFARQDAGQRQLVPHVFCVWATVDPKAAADRVLSSTSRSPGMNLRAVWTCLRAYAERDPEAALALVQKLPDSRHDRPAALNGLVAGYARSSPSEVERALALAEEAGSELRPGFDVWADLHPDAAEAWLRRQDGDRKSEAACIAEVIGAHDPQRAIELSYEFNGIEGTPHRLLSAWMLDDYEGALAWVQRHGTDEQRTTLLRQVYLQLAYDGGGDLLLEKLLAGDPIVAEHCSLGTLVYHWSSGRSDAEVLGLLDRAPIEWRDELRTVMMAGEYLEPSDDYLATVLAGGDGWSTALRTLILREPERIAELVAQVPDEGRQKLLKNLSHTLVDSDPALLLDLIDELADTGEFSMGIAQHALSSLVQFDPERAMEMAGSFEDETARRLAVTTLVSNLILDDPERALTWLVEQRGTGITEERFDGLLTSLARKVPWERERIEAMQEATRAE